MRQAFKLTPYSDHTLFVEISRELSKYGALAGRAYRNTGPVPGTN